MHAARSILRLASLLAALTCAPGARAEGLASSLQGVQKTRPDTLKLVVSVVWEGRDLQGHNLQALAAFRAAFPDLQLVHFVSPAYFLRDDAEAADAAARIKGLMRPGDHVGMALGGWRSLAAKAGVIFRSGPTFWGETLRTIDCEVDCGQDVPVNVYPQEDLQKLIATGIETLDQQGFGRVKGLATAGWVASAEVLEAASKAGIRYDFSAVASEMLAKRAFHYPLYGWAKGLWPEVTPHTQPHVLTTASSGLTEVPQSLAAVDYVATQDIETLFKEYADVAKRDASRELTFPLTMFQESASLSLPVMRRALTGIRAHAEKVALTLEPMALPGMESTAGSLPVAH